MSTKFTRISVAVAAAIGVSTSAFALDPQSVRLTDGVTFTPTLKFEQRYDDNIHATKKNTKSSWVTVVEPTFTVGLDRAKSAYQLQYRLSSQNYQSSKDSSHIDQHLTADAGFEFNSRNRLLLNAGYHKLEDTASDNAFAFKDPKNDKWNTKNVGGVYTFGAKTARTQVDFGVNYEELRYDNSQRLASGERVNKDLERDATSGKITGYYAIAPKTKLLLEGRYTDYDYKSNDLRDSENKALLAGITWEATAKTTGTVKIGREKKDYKKSFYSDQTTNMWEAGIDWSPVTYSTFSLKTRRGFDEGSDYSEFDGVNNIDYVNNSIKTVDSSLGWKHYWMDRLYTQAEYRRIDRKYQNVDRDDKIDQYGLGVTYEARRWLDVGVGYTHRENDSDLARESYKRNIYALTFNVSL